MFIIRTLKYSQNVNTALSSWCIRLERTQA